MEKKMLYFRWLRIVPILAALTLLSFAVNGQTISGKVTDENGEGLVGVNIIVKGTTNGTITNMNGDYKIEAQEGATSLIFSSIGYQLKEIEINGRTVIDVQMNVNEESLEEVVVVGYGTTKKSDLTGSVASVSEEDLRATVSTNIDQAMQGRIAGVQVTQNSGQPGGASSIRIRGASSVSGSNEPLYVVDGIPFVGDGQSIGGFDWAGGTNGQKKVNPLSTINPSDIVSIEVLKDASAAAIYGAQAANGVVIVTTRRGKNGETKISYSGYTALQELPKKLDIMNLKEYATYQNELMDELERKHSIYLQDPSLLGEGTDWQNEIFRKAWMQSHQLSITGGSDKTQYAFSGGYFNQDGIIIGSGFKRFTTRMNMDSQIKYWLKMGGSISYAQTNEDITLNDGGDGVIMNALLMQPNVPVYDFDGNFAGPTEVQGASIYNPIQQALERKNTLKRQRITGTAYASINLMKGLNLRSEYSYDLSNSLNKAFIPKYDYGLLKNDINKMRQQEDQSLFWVWKNYLTYDIKLGGAHDLKAMLGHEMQKSSWSGNWLVKQNMTSDDIKVLTSDGTLSSNDGWEDSNTQMSYFGRFNYNYDNRYLATLTLRADGSSKFGGDNKWGYFPSGSLAWRINNESFFKGIDAISNLKLRLSYGSVGNMPGNTYLYGSSMTSTPTAFGTGYRPEKFPNAALKWETTEQYNLGLDLGLFGGRVEMQVDFYQKYTRDLLLQISVPSYIGGSESTDIQAPFANVGKMENKGFDISLITRNFEKQKFKWSTNFTFSLNRNEVVELNEENAKFYQKLYWYSEFQTATLTKQGLPIGVFYGYQTEGIFQNAQDIADHAVQIEDPSRPGNNYINKTQGVWIGDIKFKDISGPDGTPDGVIDTYDQTVIGDPNPDFTFGINNSFTYGSFELSVYLSGAYGGDILNYSRVQTEGQTNIWSNQNKTVTDRAHIGLIDPNGNPNDAYNLYVTNPGTSIPRPSNNDNNRNNRMSDRFIEDGSYLRIQNISLSYVLPSSLISKVGFSGAKVYANVQNVYTFTKYTGYDPEIGSFNQNAMIQNVDMGRYPSPRIYTFGVNLDF